MKNIKVNIIVIVYIKYFYLLMLKKSERIQPETEPNYGEEAVVFFGEESSKRRVNAYIPTYISMAFYIMFLWIPGRDGTRSKVTGNFLVNALHAFHLFNRRYNVKKALHCRYNQCYTSHVVKFWYNETF